MIYKLEIYKCDNRNFNKGGKVSKRAITAKGSFTTVQPDEAPRVKTPLLEHLQSHGYTNIHTGYVDNILYMQKDGEEYVAFQSFQLSTWPNAMTIGFSSDLKNQLTLENK